MVTTIKTKWKKSSLLILLFLLIFIPKTIDIAHTMTTDETPWMMRSANFFRAIVKHDFASTNQDKNIGVFTMWINSISYYRAAPNIANHVDLYTTDYSDIERIIKESGGDPLSILAFSRLLMVFILSIAITAIAFFLSGIIGLVPSLFTATMLGYGIFYTGLMRTAHLDAPTATFMTFSAIVFLSYQYTGRKKILLILSGMIGGAALLAKLFGFMTIAVIGLIGIISIFYKNYENNIGSTKTKWLNLIVDFIIWGLSLLLVLFIFWPAMWVQPLDTIKFVFHSINPYSNATLQSNDTTIGSPFLIGNLSWFFRYVISYLWYTSPIVVIGLFLSFISFFKKIGLFGQLRIRFISASLFFSALGLLLTISMITKTAYDYLIPIQLLLNILASLGWYAVVQWISLKAVKNRAHSKIFINSTITLIAAIQIIYNLSYAPVYLSYLSPLMGGSQKANEIRMVGMGEGLDEAARYLNQKSDAEHLTAISWYGIGPFSYYFKGSTKMIPVWPILTETMVENISASDYLVTYTNQWFRRYPAQLFTILDSLQPEHEVWINGIHYANIYPVTDRVIDQLKSYLLSE